MTEITQLNHFRLLGNSGLRVSPLCLGTMTFGTDWSFGAEKEESRRIFDYYLEQGGNFIDTANNYTNGTSETWLGEWLGSHRDQLVLATKYTLNMRPGDPNAGGNHRKNMVQSVEASLKRLQTDYIDLYWVHCWEFRTPIEEVMRALDDLVRAGKILYVGISDAPAWKIAQGNMIANFRGWTPFIGIQAEYNLVERTSERDIIPMAQEFKIGILPWSPLGGGLLTGKYLKIHQEHLQQSNPDSPPSLEGGRGMWLGTRLNQRNLAITQTLDQIAQEIGCSLPQVAINWLLQKPGVVSPILGAKTLKQLEDNLGALTFTLSPEQMTRLDQVSQIDLGFPHEFIHTPMVNQLVSGGAQIQTPIPHG